VLPEPGPDEKPLNGGLARPMDRAVFLTVASQEFVLSLAIVVVAGVLVTLACWPWPPAAATVIEGKPAQPVRQPIAPTHHTTPATSAIVPAGPLVGQPRVGYAVSEVSCAPVATPA
jgi:hypothetical protein